MVPLAGGDSIWTSGAIVGRAYRLQDRIGEGGFGSVFRAERLSDHLPVAIKILSREAMGRDDGVARFQREANLAMRLTHESTIRVLGSGDAGDGTPYIAFELLEGTSLDVLLSGGALSQGRALTLANALLGSLAEAHALGIIHRDVKPANVFVCTKPDGLVKLLDFGVAKSTAPTNELGLTRDGLMVGTPAYMAPEQISGKGLGPETDLYAVALVLGETLTGKPMYDAAALQICMDKLRGVLPPIDPRIARAPFFRVMERALHTDASGRYSSAQAMRDDLATTGVRPEHLGGVRVSRSSGAVAARGTEIMDSPTSSENLNRQSAQQVSAPHVVRGSYPSDPQSDPRSDPQLAFKDTIGVATPTRGAGAVNAYATTFDPRRQSSQPPGFAEPPGFRQQRGAESHGTGPQWTPSHPPQREPVPVTLSPGRPRFSRTAVLVTVAIFVLVAIALLVAFRAGFSKPRQRGQLGAPVVEPIASAALGP